MDDEELLDEQADELIAGSDDSADLAEVADLDSIEEYPGDRIEIIPAVMPQSEEEALGVVDTFGELVQTVQLDIMDGKFVPEMTWPYKENIEGDEGHAPLKEGLLDGPLAIEVDLMIARPENEILVWSTAGATRIIAHIESIEDMDKFWEEVDWARSGATDKTLEIGIALDITTVNTVIDPYIDKIDFIQCMGIAQIGYQGQPFDERVLQKVSDLREHYPDTIISVDGGVNLETAPRLKAVGVTRLVSGSAILKSNNMREVIQTMKTM